MLPRIKSLEWLLLGCVAVLPAGVSAQSWKPSKPMTIVVPVAPGSSTDMMGRLLAERLPALLGQTVVVRNNTGASGLIGAANVARADPDGHTLLLSASTLLGAPHVLPAGASSNVDVVKDLTPVTISAASPLVVFANPDLGVNNPKALVAYLKNNPGLAYGSSGNGSPQHIGGQLFMKATGTEMTHVPYKGLVPAITDTMAGQIKLSFGALGGFGQHIDAGRLVPVAVAEKTRSPFLPNTPTFTESGIEGVEMNVFFPVFAPAGTPPEAIQALNQAINKIITEPAVKARMGEQGVETLGTSVDDAKKAVNDEYERYARVVKEFGIKAQ
ncbi:MAG: tripartite tricarboxylate transporter substrate-binding protein [Pigmentiphaga sp.]|nr:tripartite tricarboxylate transporter substrate-binding protein [Pigmentiphaga sp.]